MNICIHALIFVKKLDIFHLPRKETEVSSLVWRRENPRSRGSKEPYQDPLWSSQLEGVSLSSALSYHVILIPLWLTLSPVLLHYSYLQVAMFLLLGKQQDICSQRLIDPWDHEQ